MQDTTEDQASNDIDSPLAKSLNQLIADQRLVLGLLQRKFEPFSDIPKLAEAIWNSTEDAWDGSEEASKAPRDRSLGTEFLFTLEPCGTTVTGIDETVDHNSNESIPKCISEDNLVIARRIFEQWIRKPKAMNSSPWDENFSGKSLKGKEIERERIVSQVFEKWPKTWEPCMFSPITEPEYDFHGNEINIYYASPNPTNASEPMEYISSYGTSRVQRLREENSISGIVCQVSIQLFPGIIDFETIATIICLSKNHRIFPNWQYDFLAAHFLDWRERSVPEKSGLRDFQSSRHIITPPHQKSGLQSYGVFMHYMRSFTVNHAEENSVIEGTPSSGLKCRRESISFKAFYHERTQTLVERRYSTALNLFPMQSPGGHFALLSLIDVGQYGTEEWENSAADTQQFLNGNFWNKYGIFAAGLYTGVSIFQVEICSFIELWEEDWNETITRIDDMVSVKLYVLNDGPRLRKLVLDTNPDDLVLYFKVLQMLGRFNEIILADVARLKSLSRIVCNRSSFDYWWQKSYKHNEDTQRILEYNWDIVQRHKQQAADNLITRIKQTKEEVRGLIDGLYNVQSVTEAQKSRKLNKYLMVFTIVTVVFLPPSFAATFFGMTAFQSSDTASTRKTFWTVLGILSGLTYTIAAVGLFGANTSPTQLNFDWLERLKPQAADDEVGGSKTGEDEEGYFEIKTTPWFEKVKQLRKKSSKDTRGTIFETEGGGNSEQRDIPPV